MNVDLSTINSFSVITADGKEKFKIQGISLQTKQIFIVREEDGKANDSAAERPS